MLKKIIIDRRHVIVDALIVSTIYMLPTLSHLFPFPIYLLEPMRLCLFFCVVCSTQKSNVYFMAITMPIVSYLIAGHPIAIKNVIISIELCINAYILFQLIQSRIPISISCAISIIISKMVYYIIKYVAIAGGILSASLVDTPLTTQIITTIIISIIFCLAYDITQQSRNN